MTNAHIAVDDIIDKLSSPSCCGEVEKLINHTTVHEDRAVKERPNGVSCWYCNGCGSTWTPMIEDGMLRGVHYDKYSEEFDIIDILENGLTWDSE